MFGTPLVQWALRPDVSCGASGDGAGFVFGQVGSWAGTSTIPRLFHLCQCHRCRESADGMLLCTGWSRNLAWMVAESFFRRSWVIFLQDFEPIAWWSWYFIWCLMSMDLLSDFLSVASSIQFPAFRYGAQGIKTSQNFTFSKANILQDEPSGIMDTCQSYLQTLAFVQSMVIGAAIFSSVINVGSGHLISILAHFMQPPNWTALETKITEMTFLVQLLTLGVVVTLVSLGILGSKGWNILLFHDELLIFWYGSKAKTIPEVEIQDFDPDFWVIHCS